MTNALHGTKPRLLLVYHFFHPDDVVSARIFSDLAEEQRDRGWDVTVLTSNRLWRDPKAVLAAREPWNGIEILRVRRPAWDQASPVQRLANSAWLVAAWALRAASFEPFDAVIVGSDPAFAPLVLPAFRKLWPHAALVHWCFDLYPEAIVADGGGAAVGRIAAVARQMMRAAYRACDAVVDLGPRMRARLQGYGFEGHAETLVPWALVERSASASRNARVREVRAELFGDAELGLLYSGTMGRAHDYELFLEIARRCRLRSGGAIAFTFAGRGNRADALRASVTAADTNIRFAAFCPESELEARLEAADIHLLSLRAEWSGIVVPSKFFGSLAMSKPTVYAGPHDSDIAAWIRAFDIGMTVSPESVDPASVDAVVDVLHELCEDRSRLAAWQDRAGNAYRDHFSKARVNDAMDTLLRRLVARRASR